MWMWSMSLLTGKLVAFGKLSFIQVSKGISPRCMIYYRGQMIMSLRSAPPLEGLRNYSFDQSVMLLSRIGAMSGRVKMSKFLLTVCAFGLLLSFAFAEEKSPEQHREESNQMLGVEGIQKMELTGVVASGTNQRIYLPRLLRQRYQYPCYQATGTWHSRDRGCNRLPQLRKGKHPPQV